jgi:hypothetical protein
MGPKKQFQGAKCLTPVFRVAFQSVFKAKAFSEDQDPKFEITMLFPKGSDLSELKRVAKLAVSEKWGDSPPKNLRSPFKDGDEKEYDGFAGHITVKAVSDRRPGLVDRDGTKIISEEEFYSGCYAVATVVAFPYGGKGSPYSPGVSFGLRNIMKIRDGEPFEGGATAEEDFEDVEVDAPENLDAEPPERPKAARKPKPESVDPDDIF